MEDSLQAVGARVDRGVGRPCPTGKTDRAPAIWNCWTHNYSVKDMGFITHAFDEHSEQARRYNRALCGVTISDSGLVALGEDGWRPGCMKCCRILTARGLLTPKVRAERPQTAALQPE
jgi:hypothetical protein